MRHLVPSLLLVACLAPKDADKDGIMRKLDACPRQAETENGHRDDDGCPDELARLHVRVMDATGEPVPGAQVSLPGAPPQTTGPDGAVMWFELVPMPMVQVEAVHPDGASVQETIALPEGPTVLNLTLPTGS